MPLRCPGRGGCPCSSQGPGRGGLWARGWKKTPARPWRGCNSINEAWPWFSAANKANGPAQAWRCLAGGSGGHLLIKWGWGTMEPVVMSPPSCSWCGGACTMEPPDLQLQDTRQGWQLGLMAVKYGGPLELPALCTPPWCYGLLGTFLRKMQLVPRPGMAAAQAWHQQLPHGDRYLPSTTTDGIMAVFRDAVSSPTLGITFLGAGGVVVVSPVELQGGVHLAPLPCASLVAGWECLGLSRGVLWREVPLGNTAPFGEWTPPGGVEEMSLNVSSGSWEREKLGGVPGGLAGGQGRSPLCRHYYLGLGLEGN